MVDLGNHPFKRWCSAGAIKILLKIVGGLIAALILIFTFIDKFDQAYPIITRWGLIGKISEISGGIITQVSNFDTILIISVCVLLVLVALFIFYIIYYVEKWADKKESELNVGAATIIKAMHEQAEQAIQRERTEAKRFQKERDELQTKLDSMPKN
jgi:hypothetical protein